MFLPTTFYKQLHQLFVHSFSDDELTRLVRFELGENIDIISQGQNHSETVFEVIDWVVRRGRVDELVTVAYARRQKSPEFQQFIQQHSDLLTLGDVVIPNARASTMNKLPLPEWKGR